MNRRLSSIIFACIGSSLLVSSSSADAPFEVPAGGGLPRCEAHLASCTGDLETCDTNLSTCTASLATCSIELGTCNTNLDQTTQNLATCGTELGACNTELAQATEGLATCSVELGACNVSFENCIAELAACEETAQALPATGQTSCWDSSGLPIECTGTGQDGESQAGAALDYIDNLDGTITDNNTNLMWEKKDFSGGIHDVTMTFDWQTAFGVIEVLNNSCNGDGAADCRANGDADCTGLYQVCGYAGYRDWRLPNVKELHSIVNYGTSIPVVSEAFDNGCEAGCTVLTCSCTSSAGQYWSSTSGAVNPSFGLGVSFREGSLGAIDKRNGARVRAVRTGL